MILRTPWLGPAAKALLTTALLAACGGDDSDTAETGADEGTTASTPTTGTPAGTDDTAAEGTAEDTAEDTGCAALPQLHVTNTTGNAIEEIIMLACDMTDQVSFPVPPGGLPDGGELTIDLPGPGCWVLQYNGEGCFGDPPGMVDAACGQTVEWPLTPDSHVCAGF